MQTFSAEQRADVRTASMSKPKRKPSLTVRPAKRVSHPYPKPGAQDSLFWLSEWMRGTARSEELKYFMNSPQGEKFAPTFSVLRDAMWYGVMNEDRENTVCLNYTITDGNLPFAWIGTTILDSLPTPQEAQS